jgi:calcineurin-like phosphoesterase family protein
MRYWTSDWHLGHINIIRYSERPFDDVETMNRSIIDSMNERLGADDELWLLGDYAMGKIADTLPLIGLVHGYKVLVAGNHDRCWIGHGEQSANWKSRYEEAGFDRILQGPQVTEIEGRKVKVHHFPYRGDSHDEDRFVPYRPIDSGDVLIHGHVHRSWRVSERQYNVGVDAWGGKCVSDVQLSELIDRGDIDLQALAWL